MDLDLSYQKVNTSQNSTDIENRKISFSEVSQQNSYFNSDAIEILKDMENRQFKKLGNCYVKQINLFNLRKTIVIGPNYTFFIVGILLFFGFDLFILYNFYKELSNFLFFSNLLVLCLQLGFYSWCFISDPGIIFKQKADFSDDSTISCSTCYSTDKDRAIHCDDCGLCVSEYDHHCIWIGKCVGKKNYVVFYLFVVNTIAYFVVIIFLSGVINFSKKN